MVQYACLTGNGPPPSKNQKALSAIFQKNAIWSAGQVGMITVTFGTYRCAGCDSTAAWSNIGSESNTARPSCNLGFIDPPFNDFTFNGKTYSYENDFKNAIRNYCDCDNSISCCKGGGPNKMRGWTPGSTVVHEFCHAFGMMHEHQNDLRDSNKIKLIPENIIMYYENNGMDANAAKVNVLERYSCSNDETCEYIGSDYDPDSIMLYALLDDWIDGKNPTYPNFVLSQTDKKWLTSRYPSTKEAPQLTVEFIDDSEPEWKMAWTMKTLIENLLPIVNIKMRFITSYGKDVVYNPTAITTAVIPYNKMIFPRPKELFGNELSTESIIIIVIVIVIFLLIMIFLWNKKRKITKIFKAPIKI